MEKVLHSNPKFPFSACKLKESARGTGMLARVAAPSCHPVFPMVYSTAKDAIDIVCGALYPLKRVGKRASLPRDNVDLVERKGYGMRNHKSHD